MANARIITVADEKYFKYLKVFVNSVKINCPNIKINAYLINLSEKYSEEIIKINPNCYCYYENVSFANPMQKRCYCTNRRGYLLKTLREKTNDILIWLDADSIVRKEGLEEFLKLQENKFDVGLKPKMPKNLKKGFMGGIIILSNTLNAKIFAGTYCQLLGNARYNYKKIVGNNFKASDSIYVIPNCARYIWMANQDLLYNTFCTKNKMKFLYIPNKFLDTQFKDDGIIWTAKTSTRKDIKFNKELEKYGFV